MKSGILAFSAIACAVWLTMATEPVIVSGQRPELRPVTMEADTVTASKRGQSGLERRTATFSDYVDYLTISMQTWAEEAYEEIGTEEEYQEVSVEAEIAEAEISAEEIDSNGTVVDNEPNISGGICSDDDADERNEYSLSETDDCVFRNGESGRSGLVYLGDWTVTFYCQCEACCGRWAWSNSTASGAVPQAGWTVAAGEGLPFGSRLWIDGFGEYEVQDRGVPDGWVDIYVNDHSEIPSYGMTTASVYMEV